MKYQIITFNPDRVYFSNSWLKCWLKIKWLSINNKSAVWMECKKKLVWGCKKYLDNA